MIASAPLDRIQADANTADLAGGAIYAANLNLTLSNSTLAGNRAQQAGGGIAFQTAGALSLSNATVSGNSSVQASGGGIYSAAATTLELASSTVAGCRPMSRTIRAAVSINWPFDCAISPFGR